MMKNVILLYRVFRNEVFVIPSKVFVVVFVISLLLFPVITTHPFAMRIMILASIFTIFTASWDLIAVTGQVNLGHAFFFGVSAYAAALLNKHFGLPPWITVPVGGLFAVIAGLFIGIPALRVRGFYLALITLAFPVMLLGIVLVFSEFTGGELGLFGVGRLSSSRVLDYYIVTLIMLGCVWAMWKLADPGSRIIRTGVVVRAIREDEISARASGINTAKYKILFFCISGFFAGIAGSLYAHFMRIAGPSTLELFFSFQAILWAVFGGIGTIYGAVAGVFVLFPLVELLGLHPVGNQIRMAIFALVLMVILIFMPEGIVPWVREKIEIRCQRCKAINAIFRRHCRMCSALLHLEKNKSKEME